MEQVLQHLADYYAYERRGIRLIRMENQYQLVSAPEYGEVTAGPLKSASLPGYPSLHWRY